MKTKLLYFIIYLLSAGIALPSVTTHAQTPTTYSAGPQTQYGSGIVNSAGQWAQQVGTVGAQANRNTADQLFQQALQHKAQGIATLNVGLLSQALTEAQQGIKADDQARHFAQTSLQALQSGNAGGTVDLAGKYGTTEDQMRNLANTSSPYLPEVQSSMNSVGIQVNHDKAVINTPFGEFPMDAGPEDMSKAIGKVANALGFSANGAAAGVQAGLSNANSIAQKALADAQSAAAGAGRNVASTGSGSGADAGAKTDTGADAAKDAAAGGKAIAGAKASTGASGAMTAEQDMQARAAALAKSREEMLKKIGKVADSLGDQTSDLFGIVHDRYQEMRHQGAFNEYGQKMAYMPPQ